MGSWCWGCLEGERGPCHWYREAARAWVLTAKPQGGHIGIAVARKVTEISGSKSWKQCSTEGVPLSCWFSVEEVELLVLFV